MRLPAAALFVLAVTLAALADDVAPPPRPVTAPTLEGEYVNKSNRADTIRATLAAYRLPNLEGKWYYAGPFDNTAGVGFQVAYPPEKAVDSAATYKGKKGVELAWK